MNFYGQYQGPIYYFDFTSLYPAMGSKHEFPISKPNQLTKKEIESFNETKKVNFFGFAKVLVTSP